MEITLEYKGSVTPKSFKYITAKAFDMGFSATIEVDGSDAAIEKTIKAEFQKDMGKRIDAQLDHLEQWLSEKNAKLAEMVDTITKLQKEGLPVTAAAAKNFEKNIQDQVEIAAEVHKLTDEFEKIVSDWAENVREQQGRVSMVMSVKAARQATLSDKKWRVNAGRVIKAVLVVAAVALSVAALVLSAGTLTPIFLGLAIAGASLSGISSLGGLVKTLKSYGSIEEKIMENVKNDVKTIAAAFKPIAGSSSNIAKHVTELKNLIKTREDELKGLANDMKKWEVQVSGYQTAINQLNGEPLVDKGEVSAKTKAVKDLSKQIEDAQSLADTLKKANEDGKKLLDELEEMVGQLDKISTQAPNSVLSNIAANAKNPDAWFNLANTVGGMTSSVAGLGPSK